MVVTLYGDCLNLPTIIGSKYIVTTAQILRVFFQRLMFTADIPTQIRQFGNIPVADLCSDMMDIRSTIIGHVYAVLINYKLDITDTDRRQRLTHWGRVTHIYVSKLTIIGSGNGLSPERRQSIIWTNAGMLLIEPLGTNFSEILIEIQTFSLKKIRLKMSSVKCCSFRLGPNVLTTYKILCWSFYLSSAYHPSIYYADHVTAVGMFCVKSI